MSKNILARVIETADYRIHARVLVVLLAFLPLLIFVIVAMILFG